jgi:putative holliday junction resolvase
MSIFRIMGIDYGEKRVGIAVSDPMRIFSKPFTVLQNNKNIFDKLKKIIREQDVQKIVLGLPVHPDGNESEKTEEVKQFAIELKGQINTPLIFFDERYTTQDARKILITEGCSIEDSKQKIDMYAASVILKNYLESTK